MLNDLRLMELEVEASNPVDENGRFVCDKSPRFFIGQTKAGNVVRFRYDVPDEVIAEVQQVIEREPVVTDLRVGLAYADEYKRILAKHEAIHRATSGFGYRYPDSLTHRFPDVVRVTRENVQMGEETFPWLLEEYEDVQPCVVAIEDGRIVAVCHSARITRDVRVAGVDTHEGYRRKGYATAVATEWGAAVRELGAEPIYSTSIDNVASQGVAAKAALILYNTDHNIK